MMEEKHQIEVAVFVLDDREREIFPLRVTNNETKINNILFDKDKDKGLCIIDLDAIIPGLATNDFGTSTGAEDELDLEQVHFDLCLYKVYEKGYLEAASKVLTKKTVMSLS